MAGSEIDDFLRISDLISNYLKNNINEPDRAELFAWIDASEANSNLFRKILSEQQLEDAHAEYNSFDIESALAHVKVRLNHEHPKSGRSISRWLLGTAASVLVFFVIGLTFYLHKPKNQTFAVIYKHHKILPGGNKAILTLANGKQITLNGTPNGNLINQGNTSIKKLSDGLIAYKPGESATAHAITYNTMTTPRGGQYHLILSDGTQVWLNAASSIRFPVTFARNNRNVEITGEAYFEVAHDQARPFSVASRGQTIEVLGTHFNVNSYADEGIIKTTLLQGSVKIIAGNKKHLLKPGQQSQVMDGILNVINVDTEEAIAWKNGVFHFNDASIQSVMRQLSRWYDVDVRYEGKLPERTFSGEISMNVNASQILDAMKFKKIHYNIEGKTIVVRP